MSGGTGQLVACAIVSYREMALRIPACRSSLERVISACTGRNNDDMNNWGEFADYGNVSIFPPLATCVSGVVQV